MFLLSLFDVRSNRWDGGKKSALFWRVMNSHDWKRKKESGGCTPIR